MNQDKIASARWGRIMPALFVTYSFAYVDRVNYGFAAAGGISKDLGLSPTMGPLISATFFLGYFAAQVPGAIYAERTSAKRMVTYCLVLWGLLSAATGIVSNVPGLLSVRFLLGIVEAGVFPSLLIFVNQWFTRSERSLANTFIVLATPISTLWMSIVSGYLVSSFGWRHMFILEGLPSVLWAAAWWVMVQDRPTQAKWLTPDEARAVEAKIASEQQGLKAVRSYGEAFRIPTVIRMAILYFFWGLGLFGFVLWLPSIIKEGGSTMVATGWLSAGPYLAATVVMFAISVMSDRTRNRKPFVWPCLLAGGIAFLTLYFGSPLPFWAWYTCLTICGVAVLAPLPSFFAILPDLLPKNVAGGANALINALGALGGFAGTYLVGYLNGLTNNPKSSFLLMGTALMIATALLLVPDKLKPLGTKA